MSSDSDPKPLRKSGREQLGLPEKREKDDGRALKVGAQLAAFGRLHGGIDLKNLRGQTLPEPAEFE
jgi:hypothetical protein